MENSVQPLTTNFVRNIIENDLKENKFQNKRWAGSPGFFNPDAPLDSARIRTRFPPEPNGYLHLGHAKSILLNFGLAKDFHGECHLRFDDTNPEKEDETFIKAIEENIAWLGCEYQPNRYWASNYFEAMLQCAEFLIRKNLAYVDSQSAEEIKQNRGTLTESGKNSPFRERSIEENLTLFSQMQRGDFEDGAHVLRAKIDMASGNINLRDPVIYRIRHVEHHNTGKKYCVYPMYTFAHPIEDALECITHSICTLEFEEQRPFYDWLLNHLAEGGFFQRPLPHQYEFSRLNLSHVVLSKRKLIELVNKNYVSDWDDPRLPTLSGAKRRGYSPRGIQLFIERIGVSKSDSLIDYTVFEDCQREVLNDDAPRRIAVLNPLKLILDNYPENQTEICLLPNHPQKPEWGRREIPFGRTLWIEKDDFMEKPEKGFRRLFIGNKVRLRYAYVIECTHCDKNEKGEITAVHAQVFLNTKSGTEGSDSIKTKGNIHWLFDSFEAEINLYERLFTAPLPGQKTGNFLDDFNPHSKTTLNAKLECSLKNAQAGEIFQFERLGYFVKDLNLSSFNKTVDLKNTWNPR